MAASFSRPECKVCAEMADNLACGSCSSLSATATTTVRKRRDVARRAFKRGGIIPTDGSSVRATLKCANDHVWHSDTTPGRDDSVAQPQCDTCGQFYKTMSLVKGTFNASIACRDNCKKAKDFICECSCGGSAHGIHGVNARK
jgi:hypothetical protein